MTTPDTSIASRELDAFIHENVLGLIARECRQRHCGCGGEYQDIKSDVLAYSSSRSAAFELLSTFDTFRMYRGECENGEDCLSVSIDIWYNDESCWRQFNANGQYKDVALLICQAVIKAKGLSL